MLTFWCSILGGVLMSGNILWAQVTADRVYGSDYKESRRLYETAVGKKEQQHFAEALELLNLALYLQPNYMEAYYQRAQIKEQLEDPKSALVDYQIVLQLDTTFQEAAFDRAKLRFEIKQYRQAIREFEQVLTMPVTETRMVYFKSMPLSEKSGAPVDAITTGYHFEPEVHNYMGLCYHELHLYDSAIISFTQAINIKGNEPNYYVNRGLSKAAINSTKSALADFKQALIIDPDHAVAEFNLTQELENAQDLDVSVYDEIITNNPNFASPYVNRASAKMEQEDYQGAINDYTIAIELEPQDGQIRINRAIAWEKSGNYSAALKDYNKGLSLSEDLVMGFRGRGRVLAGLNRPQMALDDFTTAIELNPNDAAAFFNRALVHRGLGKMEQCCQDLQQAQYLGLEVAKRALDAYCQAD